jgi:hypothetical protein
VLSFPHPAFAMIDAEDPELKVHRSYWETMPISADGEHPADVPRTIAGIFTSLSRANFRIDTVLEPEPTKGDPRSPRWTEAMATVPATLVIRARKLGI